MKKFLAISLSLTLLLALASCGEEGTSSTASTASTASTVSTVSVAPVSSAATSSAVAVPSVVSSNVSSEADASGKVNVALNGKAIEETGGDEYFNDEQTGKMTPDRAFDGDLTTGWQLAKTCGDGETMDYGDGIYIGATWETAATIDEINIYFEAEAARPFATEKEGYIVEYTTDGKKWKEIKDAEYTLSTSNAVADKVTFEAIEDVTGVRVVIYKSNGKYSPKVYEIEVNGTAAEADAE